mgnify:CR=1 FL=1|tara:strand:- start:78 stop:377 length:300 start_codon:yes stop_codon:yes gene_type:complete
MEFNERQMIQMLSSLGISPENFTPEKMEKFKRLAQCIQNPSNIGSQESTQLLRELDLGININNNPKPKPKKRTEKIGRNDKCPCESGKKYKKCCGSVAN